MCQSMLKDKCSCSSYLNPVSVSIMKVAVASRTLTENGENKIKYLRKEKTLLFSLKLNHITLI